MRSRQHNPLCLQSSLMPRNNQFSTQLSVLSALLSIASVFSDYSADARRVMTMTAPRAHRKQRAGEQSTLRLVTSAWRNKSDGEVHKCQQSWLRIVAAWHYNAAGAQARRVAENWMRQATLGMLHTSWPGCGIQNAGCWYYGLLAGFVLHATCV